VPPLTGPTFSIYPLYRAGRSVSLSRYKMILLSSSKLVSYSTRAPYQSYSSYKTISSSTKDSHFTSLSKAALSLKGK
jgi:hypothetical protein